MGGARVAVETGVGLALASGGCPSVVRVVRAQNRIPVPPVHKTENTAQRWLEAEAR
jgi:hypothetical protein